MKDQKNLEKFPSHPLERPEEKEPTEKLSPQVVKRYLNLLAESLHQWWRVKRVREAYWEAKGEEKSSLLERLVDEEDQLQRIEEKIKEM